MVSNDGDPFPEAAFRPTAASLPTPGPTRRIEVLIAATIPWPRTTASRRELVV